MTRFPKYTIKVSGLNMLFEIGISDKEDLALAEQVINYATNQVRASFEVDAEEKAPLDNPSNRSKTLS